MSSSKRLPRLCALSLLAVFAVAPFAPAAAHAASNPDHGKMPWMNKTLSPDQRADLVLAQMTLDEKIQMVHGQGWGVLRAGDPIPEGSNFGAGFMAGIPRLGIPNIDLADSAVGIRMAAYQGRYATLLPSTLGAASSFDSDSAFLYGSVIGRELRADGGARGADRNRKDAAEDGAQSRAARTAHSTAATAQRARRNLQSGQSIQTRSARGR